MIIRCIIILAFMINIVFMQCDYEIGDANSDGMLDVIDIVEIVDFIINDQNSYEENFDLNFDSIVDIIDIIKLINRIFSPYPLASNLLDVTYDFSDLGIIWSSSSDGDFIAYNLYYSNIISAEELLIYSTESIVDTSIIISDLSLKEQNWFKIGTVDFMGCELLSDQFLYELPYKQYNIDSLGNVINGSFDISDFDSAEDCQACHTTHYEEWSSSMHSYTAHSPLFFSYKNETLENHPNVTDKFCSQCHNPVAFLTGTNLSEFTTVEEFQSSNLENVIKEGISCDVCHTVTGITGTVHTSNSGAATANYKLYPGENIKFGPIEFPESNNFHNSFYLPTYQVSEQCLPCHDLVVRDVEAEITFTEWNRIPGFSMFGGIPCQTCHMPEKEDGTHDHNFIGVDMDLSIPYIENPLFEKVSNMLASAVEMRFEILGESLPSMISNSDTLSIPLTIESLTAHSVPSGTSFNREAWIELIVENNSNIIYSSGVLVETNQLLDYDDDDLLVFKTYLLDETGDTTNSVIDSFDIINNSLQAYSLRFKEYDIIIPDEIEGTINITARMLFRPFEPTFILNHHEEFIDNLPVFEMYLIQSTIEIE